MSKLEFNSDLTGGQEVVSGSDGRLNVSSRYDTREYYNSRDVGRAFSAHFDHQSAVAGEFSFYWQNTDTSRALVLSQIKLNSVAASRIKVWLVTGTAAGGTSVTPVNMNRQSSNDAAANCRAGSSGSGITGLTTVGDPVNFLFVPALSGVILDLGNRLILGQNDAIAVEYDEGTTGDFGGTANGFYERQ